LRIADLDHGRAAMAVPRPEGRGPFESAPNPQKSHRLEAGGFSSTRATCPYARGCAMVLATRVRAIKCNLSFMLGYVRKDSYNIDAKGNTNSEQHLCGCLPASALFHFDNVGVGDESRSSSLNVSDLEGVWVNLGDVSLYFVVVLQRDCDAFTDTKPFDRSLRHIGRKVLISSVPAWENRFRGMEADQNC